MLADMRMKQWSSPGSSDFPALLLVSIAVAWCSLLWGARFYFSESSQYFYMLYNLALAVIPLGLSAAVWRAGKRWSAWPLAFVWLAFFPNAPYVLTDLIHLRPRQDAPFWFDWIFLLSCAGAGLLAGLVSLRHIHLWLKTRFGAVRAEVALIGILALTGFGIYLGRFPRWNSWDLVLQPSAFFGHLLDLAGNSFEHPRMIAYSFGVSFMLVLGYLGMRGCLAIREREG